MPEVPSAWLPELWNAAKTASPFAALYSIALLLAERYDRKAKEKQVAELLERTLKALNDTNTTLQTLLKVFATKAGK